MSFKIIYSENAKADLDFHAKNGNKKLLLKIFELIGNISETPFEGLGKPEPLKYGLTGRWSRRINREHRIVYIVREDSIELLSLKGHYEK